MRRKKLLPEQPLFLGRVPWRKGKRLNMCRNPRLGTKIDFKHSKNFGVDRFCQKILEELRGFERHWQVLREKSLPKVPLFLGRVPWARGTGVNMCRNP